MGYFEAIFKDLEYILAPKLSQKGPPDGLAR
jgi:hypothetical protein